MPQPDPLDLETPKQPRDPLETVRQLSRAGIAVLGEEQRADLCTLLAEVRALRARVAELEAQLPAPPACYALIPAPSGGGVYCGLPKGHEGHHQP